LTTETPIAEPGRRIPESILIAIHQAVVKVGGTTADAIDLAETWERLQVDKRGRLARLRWEAQNPVCHCKDGGVPDDVVVTRCVRCWGRRNG
jgi:hypothetical protein